MLGVRWTVCQARGDFICSTVAPRGRLVWMLRLTLFAFGVREIGVFQVVWPIVALALSEPSPRRTGAKALFGRCWQAEHPQRGGGYVGKA